MVTFYTGHLAVKYSPRFHALSEEKRKEAVAEAVAVFDSYQDRVILRGAYVTQAFQAHTDLLFWMYSERFEDLQDLQLALRRTAWGKSVDTPYAFAGLTKEFEFSAHPTSFDQGIPPREYLCFYPFIRTPEYYLLTPGERKALLEEHGIIGHKYVPGILTNGVYGFGLGDFEWLLSFETDDLKLLVDCVRDLRSAKARLYTKYEWPFIVGRRFKLAQALEQYN